MGYPWTPALCAKQLYNQPTSTLKKKQAERINRKPAESRPASALLMALTLKTKGRAQ